MWICLSDAFFSIVKDDHSALLKIRARAAGDIERYFPNHHVTETLEGSDYVYRTYATKEEIKYVLMECIDDIEYLNFKKSVKENWRHRAYTKIWEVMFLAQHRLLVIAGKR